MLNNVESDDYLFDGALECAVVHFNRRIKDENQMHANLMEIVCELREAGPILKPCNSSH